ncbi:MAG: bifunctional 4-hydroxy-2-oxoglutarate aldolase/2-dehydro-3-deoxy-phosphogluconate aldolase [Flavitalea sp.]
MKTNEQALSAILKARALPLFYHDDPKICLDVMHSLYAAGIRSIEFTNRGVHALANFKSMLVKRDEEMKDLLLGIGTIKTLEHLEQFDDAGADFFVSPIVDPVLLRHASSNERLFIPGCMTPTEIYIAENEGCELVKIFPGNVVGHQFIRSIKELFPSVKYMVTGGVECNKENLENWFNAGVHAVGLGSSLISRDILNSNSYDKLQADTRSLLSILATITSQTN